MQTQTVRSETPGVWVIDPAHSTVEFSVKNLFFFAVKGRCNDLTGKIVLDEGDIGRSSVEATIKAASVDTGSARRDTHLRSADCLDADRYPDIRFQSTKVEPGTDRDTLRITGSLVVCGKTREVVLEVNDIDRSRSPSGEDFIYYTATTELDRFDFGITYWRGFIGRKLKVAINVQGCSGK